MYAACSKISYLPVAATNVLSSLQDWIFDKNKTPATKVEILSSTSPILMKNNNNDHHHHHQRISIAVIHNPDTLSSDEKNQIYKLTLPYTSRAFKQDFATMDQKSMQEHIDHTTPGDYLFLAVVCVSEKEKVGNDHGHDADENCSPIIAPKIVFHLLCSVIDINNNTSTSSSSTTKKNSKKAMCCSAYCADPSFQNCGLATIVHTAAVEFLRPDLIIMRTVNPSMLKLLRRTSPPGSKLYPNDCRTEEDWMEARSIARDAIKQWEHLSSQVEKYDEEKLVFKGAYSTELDEVFNKKNNNNHQEETSKSPSSGFQDIHVNPGDAQLRIVVLAPSTQDVKKE